MLRLDSQGRTERTVNKRTSRAGQLELDSWSRTGRTERQKKTARIRPPGQGCQDKAARTGLPKQDYWD